MRVFSRGAAIRLGVLAGLLAGGATYAYVAMIRMPGRSYAGALEPLDARGQARAPDHGVAVGVTGWMHRRR